MKLYVGGAFQGQAELARAENPGRAIFDDFHTLARDAVDEGVDAGEFARAFIEENPDAVVVANEVGMGVVPQTARERAWREAAGRALCLVAQKSESVTRVCCGIPYRLK